MDTILLNFFYYYYSQKGFLQAHSTPVKLSLGLEFIQSTLESISSNKEGIFYSLSPSLLIPVASLKVWYKLPIVNIFY